MIRYSKYIDPYINKILNNEVEHCKYQELMIKNIVIPVLNRDDVFIDETKIEKGLSLQKYFSYNLIEWEVFLFALIVGLFIKLPGNVINNFFKDIRIIIGRGNGKNGFISFLAFYLLSEMHGVKNYDIEILANSEDQAKVSFDDIYNLLKNNSDVSIQKKLNKHFKATKEKITCIKTNSILKFNSSSNRGKDSKRTGCVIFDEKHEYIDGSNMNTLTSGLGKVEFPRIITITTNGTVRGGVLDNELEQNKDILKEYNPNNRVLVFWCKLDKFDEWKQEDKWIKANPSINNFPLLKEQIKDEVSEMPFKMDYFPTFMAKRMNFPVGTSEQEVASWENLTECLKPLVDIKNKTCVGGIDFAKSDDFVGVCLLFKTNNMYYLLHHTFVCKNSRDLEGVKAPIKEWEQLGYVTYIDDVEISPDIITDWFMEMKDKYHLTIKKIGVDNYRLGYLNNALKRIGFDACDKEKVKIVRPSDILKIVPIINSVFINHQLIVGEDAYIFRWMANNVKKEPEKNGNYSYQKIERRYRKTDTFFAFVHAFISSEDINMGAPILEQFKKFSVITF